MTHTILPSTNTDKEACYKELIPQIESLIKGETDSIAMLANVVAVLKESFNFFWVGFYVVKNNYLSLYPFQGPIACSRIGPGAGVCGTAWREKRTIIVDDVETFEGHIACSSLSRSEIVIPLFRNQQVWGVLDIDSDHLSAFDATDAFYLAQITTIISRYCTSS